MNGRIFIVMIISVLAIIGFSTVIRAITYALFRPKNKDLIYKIIALSGEYADIHLKGAIEKIVFEQAFYDNKNERIIAIDLGLDCKMKNAIGQICDKYAIDFCDSDSFFNLIKQNEE